jgi:hypothetical protein
MRSAIFIKFLPARGAQCRHYIKNMSFFLDMLILLSTAHKVLFAKVALHTKAKEGRKTASPQEISRLELPHLSSLTISDHRE